jgi:DNA-binding response OmpR family regulator
MSISFMQESKINLRVLVVEDDQRMLDLLCRGLRDFGHTAMPASEGDAGFELAMIMDFDVIVLDVCLPKRDGCEIAQTLRAKNKGVPILMLTARDAEDDIIRGLESGADDYLLKPFSFAELLVRLHTLVRTNKKQIDRRGLYLDAARFLASRGDVPIQLTRSEFLLLGVLHQKAGLVVSRQAMIDAVWRYPHMTKANALDVLVNALRTKLDGPFAHKMIETIRGVGYRLRPDVDAGVMCNREPMPTLQPKAHFEEGTL